LLTGLDLRTVEVFMAKTPSKPDDHNAPGAMPPGLKLSCNPLSGHKASINRIAWSPDGQMLASGSFDNSVRIWNVNSCNLNRELRGHQNPVYTVAWSPNWRWLASGSVDKTIRLWDLTAEDRVRVIREHTDSVISLAWSPEGERLASGSGDRTIRLWDAETGEPRKTLHGHTDSVITIAWSPGGGVIASGSGDKTIRLWDAETGEPRKTLQGHSSAILSLVWLDDQTLVSGSDDHTIRLWNVDSGLPTNVLEGHTDPVYSVALSAGGRLLASKADDNSVRLWRCDTWEPVTKFDELALCVGRPGVAFHPTSPFVLATLGAENRVIRIWDLDLAILLDDTTGRRSAHYTNAKVVLVGDSGVGKTGLGNSVRGEKFRATESTHGLDVWLLEKDEVPLSGGRTITRETFLWDLAGQPGYRLIHQLHLGEVAVALVLFDSRSETDPFAGVAYWARALDKATSGFPLVKFLVASRIDRGGPAVSQDRIEEVLRRYGFAGFFRTSAKRGDGIVELRQEIRQAIAWDKLPKVSTTDLFMTTRNFLLDQKEIGRIVATTDDDLFDSFKVPKGHADTAARDVFETCLGRLESAGLIRRLSFGDYVLLQPEMLDDYCGWLVLAARDQPDGLGFIPEDDAKQGRFPMDAKRRLAGKPEEQIILLATVQELIGRRIAYRQETDKGVMLVFPSELNTELPVYPRIYSLEVAFRFEGPVTAIYAILAVTLIHSKEEYKKEKLYKYAALYRGPGSQVYGFAVEFADGANDAKGKLTVFFEANTPEGDRKLFLRYLNRQLENLALEGSVIRERIYYCSECDHTIPQWAVELRVRRGETTVVCPSCVRQFSIDDLAEQSTVEDDRVREIDDRAEEERKRQVRLTTLLERERAGEFDVFLCYNWEDKPRVQELTRMLRDQGISYWMDEEQIRAGDLYLKVLGEKINASRVVVVCSGPKELGPTQEVEYDCALRKYIDDRDEAGRRRIRIVPVLLPGALPHRLPPFLGGFDLVDFRDGLGNVAQLRKLVRAITDPTPQF
jgi:small GTP-binding protein